MIFEAWQPLNSPCVLLVLKFVALVANAILLHSDNFGAIHLHKLLNDINAFVCIRIGRDLCKVGAALLRHLDLPYAMLAIVPLHSVAFGEI